MAYGYLRMPVRGYKRGFGPEGSMVIRWRAGRPAIFACIMAALVTAVSGTARAEDLQIGPLQILDPRASAAAQGADSRIQMRIVNGGYDNVHIVRMTSPVAREITIDLPTGSGTARPLGSIAVPANDGTSVGPSQIRVLLTDLRKRIRNGDRIPVTLHFSGGQQVDMEVTVAGGADEMPRSLVRP